MNEQKQIEEMAKIASKCITSWLNNETPKTLPDYIAKALYTADYRKQIAGEWVVISKRGLNSERNRRINYETYTCAVCGRSNGKYKANFCPNCGARMTKGDEGK